MQLPQVFFTRGDKRIYLPLAALLTNKGGHIEREKVRYIHIFGYRIQVDMVSIHKVKALEAERFHRLISLLAGISRFCAYIDMLPVRLVPDRADLQPLFICFHDSSQLSFSLMRETVTHTNTVFP